MKLLLVRDVSSRWSRTLLCSNFDTMTAGDVKAEILTFLGAKISRRFHSESGCEAVADLSDWVYLIFDGNIVTSNTLLLRNLV